MKSREVCELTYNQLAQLLKLEENSIRKVYEEDQGEEILYILHDDKRTCIDYPNENKILKRSLDLKQDFDFMGKNILAAFGIKSEDFNKYLKDYLITAEQVFNIKLQGYQVKPINDWNKTGVRKYNWPRRSGSSYCAAIDALFSASCGKLDVMYLSATRNESVDHFKMAERILKKTSIEYTMDNNSIIFSNGYLVAFRPNNIDQNGTQFNKMIFDNCDINRRIINSKCVVIREYTTYEE